MGFPSPCLWFYLTFLVPGDLDELSTADDNRYPYNILRWISLRNSALPFTNGWLWNHVCGFTLLCLLQMVLLSNKRGWTWVPLLVLKTSLFFTVVVKKHLKSKWSECCLIDDHWKVISLLRWVKLLFLLAWNNKRKILGKNCLIVLVNVQFLCGAMYLTHYRYEIPNVHLKW